MNEKSKEMLEILRFIKESKGFERVTDDFLRNRFKSIEEKNFIDNRNYFIAANLIQHSSNWELTSIGENQLSKLQAEFDVENKLNSLSKRIVELEDVKKDKAKWFWRGASVSIIAALIGVAPTIIEKSRTQPPIQHIEFPKMVIIHDTLYH